MSEIPEPFRDPKLDISGDVVGFYPREFYTFDNFSSFQVAWRGIRWATSEHAYQASHFFDTEPGLAEQIRGAMSAHDAYKLAKANSHKVPDDWDDVKVKVMEDICRHKLTQHRYIQEKLMQTGNVPIVEDSPKDSFWGWGPNRDGRNELGKIWMRLREAMLNGTLEISE
ncbi:NADAR family protein [Candidatus Saccharibacteria bacterium]|nr:NADAR family protein [Candidatus Saccharibacteria bacterium]